VCDWVKNITRITIWAEIVRCWRNTQQFHNDS
jgi:hypothetical protein